MKQAENCGYLRRIENVHLCPVHIKITHKIIIKVFFGIVEVRDRKWRKSIEQGKNEKS